MKKFLLALSVLFIISCSKKESDQSTSTMAADSMAVDSMSTMPTQPAMGDSATAPTSGTGSGTGTGSGNNTGTSSGATTADSTATSTTPTLGR